MNLRTKRKDTKVEILAYIKELLILNECVIIPGFGGFIANYKHASTSGSLFSPPTNSIVFNSKLNFNDGLLIAHVAAEANISYKQAKKRVDSLVHELNYRLSEDEHIEVPGVGSLKYDSQHRLQFSPFEFVNLNAESYGLSTFNYASIFAERIQSTVATRRDAQAIPNVASASKSPWYKKKALWITPVLLALLAIPFSDTITTNIQQSNILDFYTDNTEQVVATSPVDNQTESNELSTPVLEVAEVQNDDAAEVEFEVAEPVVEMTPLVVANKLEDAVEEDSPADVAVLSKPYHLIVGSFRSEENAQKLADQYAQEGIELVQLGYIRSLYYVSAGGYATMNEADRARRELAANYTKLANTWVYKVKQ